MHCVEELARHMNFVPKETKIAIQGFGNAGSHVADILSENGYKIVAVSDSKGGIYNPEGLDIRSLMEHKKNTKSVVNFQGTMGISNEELLELDVDILIPAALESVITQDNASKIRARTIVELANGPTTPEADEIFAEKNIVLVPDVLANAGGVTVSCFEWQQNIRHEHWSEEEVLKKLKNAMVSAFTDIWEASVQYNIPLRKAAFVKAIERIVEKMS